MKELYKYYCKGRLLKKRLVGLKILKIILFIVVFWATVFITPIGLEAAILHVPADQATIQLAIKAAADGDTVLVAPGIYAENINFLGKAITVKSEAGPEVTLINGKRLGPVVTFESAEERASKLEGFTLRNGGATYGAGITMSGSSPTIIGNIFDTNRQYVGGFGAGIGGNSASPIVKKNIFRNNSCDDQGLSGVVSFVNYSSPLLVNNIFENNPCRAINMALPRGSNPKISNNTIIGNRAGVRLIAQVSTALQLYRNNIIVANEIGVEVLYFGSELYNPKWKNNLVFNNLTNYVGIADQTGINGNISVDPVFVDPANGDYHIQSGSPVIDVGDNTAPELPATDFDGNPRILDGNGDGIAVVDMGVYEFNTSSVVVTVNIDVKPGSFSNNINPRSRGKIPVAILTTDIFDATSVDPTTVRFGVEGTEAAPVHFALEDVTRDGKLDMILQFKTQETGIKCGNTSSSLTGETFSGQMIQGSDSVKTVGCSGRVWLNNNYPD